ncbi:MAG: exonuclease SbcCD subunit D [Hyphomicrobium sp.]
MRLLHTADWHLGRHFEGRPLEDDHAAVLDQVFQAIVATAPDALIIAGDIYDRASPPESAVRQFNDFIRRVASETDAAIVLIAGNHDSGDRIGAMAMLADRRRALVRGPILADEHPLVLDDGHGPVAISALPFAYEYAARECFATSDIKSPADVMAAQVAAARRNVPAGARWVVVAHAFVTGAVPSDSERSLSRVVGGIETVPSDIFDGAHYTALGHLHRPQVIGGDRIRYSGSPLAFGFDEEGCDKSMVVIDLDRVGSIATQLIPFSPLRRVRTLRGRLLDLLAGGSKVASDDFIRIVLTDPERLIDPMKRIREIYPNANMTYERDDVRLETKSAKPGRTAATDPAQVVADFLEFARGAPPSTAEAAIVAGELLGMTGEGAAG